MSNLDLHQIRARIGDVLGKEIACKIFVLPEVENALGKEEERVLATRRALVERLAGLAAKHGDIIAEAARAAGAAARKLESSEAKLREMREEHQLAVAHSFGAQAALQNETAGILRELYASRDRRLDDAHLMLDRLADRARGLVVVTPVIGRGLSGTRDIKYLTNVEEVAAARAALIEGKARIHDLMLEVVSYADVSEHLTEIFAGLKATLAALELRPPSIGKDGAVEPPAQHPAVIVEKEAA